MEMIIDFILLAVSGAAAFYCFVLSKKLEELNNTKKGLGATIATMSHTVDQARAAVSLAKESSAESVQDLSPLIEESREILPKLTEMIDVLGELVEIAINDINAASRQSVTMIDNRSTEASAAHEEIMTQLSLANETISNVGLPRRRNEPSTVEDDNVAYIDNIEPPPDRAASRVAKALHEARSKHLKTHIG